MFTPDEAIPKRLFDIVDTLLWAQWDPLDLNGTDWPDDEYRSYVEPALRCVMEPDCLNCVTEYLLAVEVQRMLLAGDPARARTIASLICAAVVLYYEREWG